jgi:hypothetical protein
MLARKDFKYWNGESFIKEIASSLQPYAGKNLKGFQADFDYHLRQTGLFTAIKYLKNEDLACMITIDCKLQLTLTGLGTVGDTVIETWNNCLAFDNQKVKVDYRMHRIDKAPWSKIKAFSLYFAI